MYGLIPTKFGYIITTVLSNLFNNALISLFVIQCAFRSCPEIS